ncbi:MAG: CPA1 family monovalent cation:H+ antiporter [Cyclobacteriaceae bacterium]|jgi:CPA1 family monovalent cation:H+ antiporter
MHIFDIIALLIFFSGLFIFINSIFLKLPSSIGHMILALILSLTVLLVGTAFPSLHLAAHVKEYDFAEILSQFVLSVMLFAGALNVNFRKLRDQLVPVILLAIFGVLISTFTIGTLVFYLLDFMGIYMNYSGCLVFGALISSTDPIAVTKIISRFNLSKKLETKISGESLLNAGFAVVVALAIVGIHKRMESMEEIGGMEITWILVKDIGGGIILGLIVGWVGHRILHFVDNEHAHIEVLVTLALVLTGSWLGDLIFVSSKAVAMVSGLFIANYGAHQIGEEDAVGVYVFKFWRLMEESMAVMLFVLIGFEMLVIPLRLDYFAAGFFTVNIVLFSRWISVFIPISLLSMKQSFDNSTISVLSWGALRGGLPVAVSLSLTDFAGKEIIVTLTYVVVVCSVLYQGLTANSVMRLYQQRAPKLS